MQRLINKAKTEGIIILSSQLPLKFITIIDPSKNPNILPISPAADQHPNCAPSLLGLK
jgi:hypothetical protein